MRIPGVPGRPKVPTSGHDVAHDAKSVAIKTGERAVVRGILAVISAIGLPVIIVVVVIGLILLITVGSVLGHASQDPDYAQTTGLDSVFGNTPTQSAEQCNATGDLPSVPSCSISSSAAMDSALLTNFGLTLTGNSADCNAKEAAFVTYSELFQSSKYASLAKNSRITKITMTDDACAGLTRGDNFRIGDCDNHSLPYFYTHEMGHVIRNNNPSLGSSFANALPGLVNADKNCYSGQFLRTYLLRQGVDPKSESFAESIALYYLGGRNATFDPSRGFFGEDILDFKSQCPATYVWVKDNVFGGYEFDDSSAGSCSINASSDSCGGAYNISQNPTGKNFGDPSCELVSGGKENKQLVADEIMRQLQSRGKAQDFCKWACIVHSESGFDPNSYNGHASRPNLGAWGLFQFLPYASYDTSKPNFYYRAGNISWKDQISRALTLQYNFLIPWQTGVKTNGYWSSYKSHCYLEPDWKPGGSCIPNTTGGVNIP